MLVLDFLSIHLSKCSKSKLLFSLSLSTDFIFVLTDSQFWIHWMLWIYCYYVYCTANSCGVVPGKKRSIKVGSFFFFFFFLASFSVNQTEFGAFETEKNCYFVWIENVGITQMHWQLVWFVDWVILQLQPPKREEGLKGEMP